MKIPLFPCCVALAAGLGSVTGSPLFAQDLTPPVVQAPLTNVTVPVGTTRSVVKLNTTFALSGVTGQIVRIATSVKDDSGNPLNIDVEVLASAAPANAANFLSYVTSGRYNQTFIHRLASAFVLQGGGYYLVSSSKTSSGYAAEHLPSPASTVPGEHTISNTRGTLAFALSNGPDTANSEWFFNLKDNLALDASPGASGYDGGPFTVFARVIEADLAKMDTLGALPIYDLNTDFGYDDDSNSPFGTVPADVPSGGSLTSIDQLVYLDDVVVIPLLPPSEGADSVLTLKVKTSDPSLVLPTLKGHKLILTYPSGKTGTATIKVIAHDSAGSGVKSKFSVTVQ